MAAAAVSSGAIAASPMRKRGCGIVASAGAMRGTSAAGMQGAHRCRTRVGGAVKGCGRGEAAARLPHAGGVRAGSAAAAARGVSASASAARVPCVRMKNIDVYSIYCISSGPATWRGRSRRSHRVRGMAMTADDENETVAAEGTEDAVDAEGADDATSGGDADADVEAQADEETEATAEAAGASEDDAAGAGDEAEEKPVSALLGDLAAEHEGGEDDLGARLGALSAETQQLEKRVKEAEAACLEVNLTLSNTKESYLRLNADFDNFRKRTIREKEEIATRGRGDVLEELLPLIDNFEMAAKSIKIETEGEEKINNSYQGLYRQMIEIMKKAGLSVVESVGKPFDPEIHDAIMREPTSEFEDGSVMEEFRRGFKFGDTLLRPAMVKVAVAPEEDAAAEAGGDAGDAAAEGEVEGGVEGGEEDAEGEEPSAS